MDIEKPRGAASLYLRWRLPSLHVVNDGYAATLPLLLPFAAAAFGLGLSKVGLLGAVLNAAGMVLAVPAGALALRFGGLRVLGWAFFAYAAAFAAFAASVGFWSLLGAFVLASLGFGLFHPIAFAAVVRGAPEGESGRAMGFFTSVGDLGRIGISAAAAFVAALAGWRETALGLCLGGLAAAACYAWSVRKEAVRDDRKIKAAKGGSFAALGKDRRFVPAVAAAALDSLASSSLFIFLPFLLRERGGSPALAGIFTGVFFAGNLLGKTALGRFSDSLGPRRLFLVAELATAACVAALGAVPYLPALAVLAFLAGAFSKGTVPIVNGLVAEAAASASLERAFGVSAAATGAANVLGPLVLGVLAARFGIGAAFFASAACALLAMVPAAWGGRASGGGGAEKRTQA